VMGTTVTAASAVIGEGNTVDWLGCSMVLEIRQESVEKLPLNIDSMRDLKGMPWSGQMRKATRRAGHNAMPSHVTCATCPGSAWEDYFFCWNG
jgi:hypothetical protein